MIFLWLLIGLTLPAIAGWLMVRLLEWTAPVLGTIERWMIGLLLGLTATMYVTFLAHVILGVRLSLSGFASVQLALLAMLGLPYLFFARRIHGSGTSEESHSTSEGNAKFEFRNSNFFGLRISDSGRSRTRGIILLSLLIVLGIWTTLKIAAGSFMLVATPPYLDDTVKNWNMRGKTFFFNQELVLLDPSQHEGDQPGGVNSYPPTVPLVKAWLAQLGGRWEEGLVNTPHLFWYLSALSLLFFFLRREADLLWAMIGTYLLSSLPLYLIHGTNAYSDTFLSAHIFAALAPLLLAVREERGDRAASWMRIAALALALLIFTKNEGLVLYFPPLVVGFLSTLWWLKKRGVLHRRDAASAIVEAVLLVSAVLIPWLAFKWFHGLPFGNAKSLTGLNLGWQPGVLLSIVINTFFEGNWLLLFPLLLLLLDLRWRQAFLSPLLLFTAFFLIVYTAQLPLYFFTELSYEARLQTGYARGLIHLAPVAVAITILLLSRLIAEGSGSFIAEALRKIIKKRTGVVRSW